MYVVPYKLRIAKNQPPLATLQSKI